MENAFEQTIINRLRTLNHTQRSIEKTSRAFLKNRHMAKELVKLWFKEFRAAADKLKLAFLHLVNDVLVNGSQKASQFAQLFEPVLNYAFRETASVQSHHIRSAVAHLLVVWAERQIYPRPFLRQLRTSCQRAASQADTRNPAKSSSKPSPFDFSFTCALINASATTHQPPSLSPALISTTPTLDVGSGGSISPYANLAVFREELQHDLELEAVKLPETGELIRQLEALQSAPSANAITRQKISEFPEEVSDPQMVTKMLSEGVDQKTMVERIQTALRQLESYNRSLDEEMVQRHNLNLSLRAYKKALLEACQQSRACIQNIREKQAYATSLQTSLDSHLRSLPDDQKYESAFLAPLPSVGDLFR
ncbi:Regulation of nuclear pre-mRNA domain-containing protein 1B [Echinococcus granulosus]|uniref:Regulation of nuclear pre mRNA domain containing protein n=1 Tax=Echinococcus granulosus TaxID=6210 RepID=U6JFY8_ECHGR|nr:Regulation of nuclear pre-mRNA domain-containing protein 1B [Echinococcus granulosus]EUB55835.1 Regulation of nuclear pre-mRNA domain-containing protein 1B [Echinococcus granulosus]CDS21371.1 regulation of nuclear pre mRNA domain containing protein [Echinococcus granulosus]